MVCSYGQEKHQRKQTRFQWDRLYRQRKEPSYHMIYGIQHRTWRLCKRCWNCCWVLRKFQMQDTSPLWWPNSQDIWWEDCWVWWGRDPRVERSSIGIVLDTLKSKSVELEYRQEYLRQGKNKANTRVTTRTIRCDKLTNLHLIFIYLKIQLYSAELRLCVKGYHG